MAKPWVRFGTPLAPKTRPATPATAVRQQSRCARAMASCDMALSKAKDTERSRVENDKRDDVLDDSMMHFGVKTPKQ